MTSMSKCINCGKPKLEHKAKSFACPQGRKTKVGYLRFDASRVFTRVIDINTRSMVVMAHDPGKTNYAVAVVKGKVVRGKLRLRVIFNNMVSNTVKQLTDGTVLKQEIKAYLVETFQYGAAHKPNLFIAERFMTRGLKGPTIEMIGIMLGAFVSRLPVPYALVGASTWKNEMKRRGLDLKEMYKLARVTPHQLDAVLMAVYQLIKSMGVPRYNLDRDRIIQAAEAASALPLKKKKGVRK